MIQGFSTVFSRARRPLRGVGRAAGVLRAKVEGAVGAHRVEEHGAAYTTC